MMYTRVWCVSQYSIIQGHETPPMSYAKLRSTSTQPDVTEMIGTSGCLDDMTIL